MINDTIEKVWLDHTYDGFPRIVGWPNQYLSYDKESFLRDVWRYLGWTDCLTGVYPSANKKTEKIDGKTKNVIYANKLYLDVDVEDNLTAALFYTKRLAEVLTINYDANPRIYFSGKKGFAIYVDFPAVRLINYRVTVRSFARRLLQEAGFVEKEKFVERKIRWLDWSVLDNGNRMSRIPFTIHPKSKLLCTPIRPNDDLIDVAKRANGIDPYVPPRSFANRSIGRLLLEIDSTVSDIVAPTATKGEFFYSGSLDEELKRWLAMAKFVVDGRHRIIFAMIVPRLVANGYSDSDAREYCLEFLANTGVDVKKDDDWLRFIDYQIGYRRENNYVWSYYTFFNHYPDLYPMLKRAEDMLNDEKTQK